MSIKLNIKAKFNKKNIYDAVHKAQTWYIKKNGTEARTPQVRIRFESDNKELQAYAVQLAQEMLQPTQGVTVFEVGTGKNHHNESYDTKQKVNFGKKSVISWVTDLFS